MGPALPRWDLHIACGISITVLYSFCAIFPSLVSDSSGISQSLDHVSLTLLIGSIAVVVGSLLPDIDGKGRVRWIIGPVIGASTLTLMGLRAYLTGGIGGSFSYMADDGAFLFLAGTALGYGSLLLPLRHRGIMHRVQAAIVFCCICAGAFVLVLVPDPVQGAVVGAMAFSGYGWHLALDGSI